MTPTTNRKVLDGLPVRRWDAETTYDSLLLVPSGKKHDSGYHQIAIVGCEGSKPKEIAAYCDDIGVRVATASPLLAGKYLQSMFRVDMSYPAGYRQLVGRQVHCRRGA